MKRSFYPNCQKGNPCRRPDWRWVRASELFQTGRYYSARQDDAETGRALLYLRGQFGSSSASRRRRILQQVDDIAAAHQLSGGPTLLRIELEARIFARQSASEITRRVPISAQSVVAYERLFFNVTDRLDASDYILLQAIGELLPPGWTKPDFARLVKLVGYQGGLLPLDAFLSYLAQKENMQWLGATSSSLAPATYLAIDAFVTTYSLQIDKSTAFHIASKGKHVHEILEKRPPKPLLADLFAAQTAAIIENLATRTGGRTAEGPLEEPAESESVEAA